MKRGWKMENTLETSRVRKLNSIFHARDYGEGGRTSAGVPPRKIEKVFELDRKITRHNR
jgi:hypothetical protein